MAGKITVSTINDSSGVLATQNGMTGIAKAWVNFNGTGTIAIRSSFNVSSITDRGTGLYTVNFTTAMPDANYSVTSIASSDLTTQVLTFIGGTSSVVTTSSVAIDLVNPGVGNVDRQVICVTINGN